MAADTNRYWGYRIDTDQIEYFREELEGGRLRQGWGFHPGQDLRKWATTEFVAQGAHKNWRIFEQVKKGHILLVPRLPRWERVAIVEATEDFDVGYTFKIDPFQEDYGHRFPAKIIGSFTRSSRVVSGDIRTTLRCRGRFWSLDVYREDIRKILMSNEAVRTRPQEPTDGLQRAVQQAFKRLGDDLLKKLGQENEGKDWETILAEIFAVIYPDYEVEVVAGQSEGEHGTDILISVPGIGADAEGNPEHDYAIAIQVKDQNSLTKKAIQQIQAAPSYWKAERGLRFVDTCVVLTKAETSDHMESGDTKIIWERDLRTIVEAYARRVTSVGRGERLGE